MDILTYIYCVKIDVKAQCICHIEIISCHTDFLYFLNWHWHFCHIDIWHMYCLVSVFKYKVLVTSKFCIFFWFYPCFLYILSVLEGFQKGFSFSQVSIIHYSSKYLSYCLIGIKSCWQLKHWHIWSTSWHND